MKYLKIYEKYNNLPILGDYVVVYCESMNEKFNDFINNNIGKLNNYGRITDLAWVEYFNIPEELKKHFDDDKYAILNTNTIKYFSSDKKNVEAYLKAQKFNI